MLPLNLFIPYSFNILFLTFLCLFALVFPSHLKCIVGRIMENYLDYIKLLESEGVLLPNNTESNYWMFQHPFHGKGSVLRDPHHEYESHLVCITISCPGPLRAPSVTASSIQSSLRDGCILVSTENKGRER